VLPAWSGARAGRGVGGMTKQLRPTNGDPLAELWREIRLYLEIWDVIRQTSRPLVVSGAKG